MNTPSFRSSFLRRPVLPGWAAVVVTAALLAASPIFLLAAPPEGSPTAPPSAAPAVIPAGQQQASAAELVGTMRRAAGLMARGQGAKASEAAFRTTKARAFARALAGAAERLEALGKSVQAPDAGTFGTMSQTGSALAALQVTFRYNGIEDDDLEDGFEKLTAAYGVFRRNYGRDLVAARTEAESSLSPAQRSARDGLQKRGSALSKSLGALQPALKDNPAAAFEAAAILKGLSRLSEAPRDRRVFLDHLAAAELLLGRREGLGIYLGEVFPGEGKKLDNAEEGFQAYREAFDRALAAAFADQRPAELFARPAAYVEDLSVGGVSDAELPGLLAALGKTSTAAVGAGGTITAGKPDPAADRAADAQINADDPDDDTSLDPAGGEDDPGSADRASD